MPRGTKSIKKRGKKLPNTNVITKPKAAKFVNSVLKGAGWNKSLTLRQNFAVIGLQLDPNVNHRKKSKRTLPKHLIKENRKYNLGEELNNLVDTQANLYCIGQTAAKKPSFYLTEDEIRYIRVSFL